MTAGAIGGTLGATAGLLAYAVRGKSSRLLAPSFHRGPRDRPRIALTFDDGPSESTPELLAILAEYDVLATFFHCGANVRRLPEIARQVVAAGHEVGNHSDTHSRFYFRWPGFIEDELSRAQDSIQDATGTSPRFLRVPYGARWFGLRRAQKKLGLKGVMWTVIGLDWELRADLVAARVSRRVAYGSIICLHDGRELETQPDIRETTEAVRRLLPALLARGFQFVTIGSLLCPKT